MSPEEIRTRSLYLLLSCSETLEPCVGRLAATAPAGSPAAQRLLDRLLKKELGLLFRYWATRRVWDRWDAHEADAKELNLALLRLFTDAFKLPQDGSGIRYAELSIPADELFELSHRLTQALGPGHQPLLAALEAGMPSWRDMVTKHTEDALTLPVEQLALRVKEWAGRPQEQ